MRTAGRNKAAAINRNVLGPAMRAHGIPFADPFTVYCPTGDCPVILGGTPIYYDYVHVSRPGARLYADAAARLMVAGRAAR